MNVVACYIVFNEASAIGTSIESVVDLVDFVVAVDGAYIGKEDDHDHSWDGTTDIIKQVARNKSVVIQPGRLSEPRVRNEYLRFVQQHLRGSWVFVIDSDEVLRDGREDFEWIRSNEASVYNIGNIFRNDPQPTYGFNLYNATHERTSFHPRLYRGIPGLHYSENHWALRDAFGDRVEPKYPGMKLRRAWLDHRRTLRGVRNERIRKHYDIYERWKYERVDRPLKSYLPYKIFVTIESLLYRIKFRPRYYLDYVYWYTIGSSIKYPQELRRRQQLSTDPFDIPLRADTTKSGH